MSSQPEQETQEQLTQTPYSTIKFGFPEDVANLMNHVKQHGKNFLTYVNESDYQRMVEMLKNMGMVIIEREYKLHFNAESKEAFDDVLPGVVHTVKPTKSSRYIGSIVAASKEDFDDFLELSKPECRIEPFNSNINKTNYQNFNNRRNQRDDDEHSDTVQNTRQSNFKSNDRNKKPRNVAQNNQDKKRANKPQQSTR